MSLCIFVPGIKGTELYEGDNKRWFPSTKKDLESLKADNDLVPKSVLKEVNAFFIKKVSLYSGVIDEFIQDPNFVPYPYDWRNSLLDEANKFVRFIISAAEESNTDIILIAHSMGGLLCKLAILKLQELGRVNLIKKLVTIGTPWKGAPDAFKVLEHGEPGFYDNLFSFYQIFNDEQSRTLARRLPTAYQLLPNEEYFKSTHGKFIIGAEKDFLNYYDVKSKIQQIYNEEHKTNPEDNVIDVWKEYIDPLHAAMRKPIPVQHECLVGIDKPTFYTIPERKYKTYRLFKTIAKIQNGDGVVPFYSALPLHKANIYYVNALHRSQCANEDVVNFIKWAIGDQTDSQPLGIGRLKDTDLEEKAIIENAKLKKGVLTYVMCPVETTILDKEQKYVAGVIDPSISGYSKLADSEDLQYLQIGEAKYFFVQKNEEFNFEISAYDEGIAEVGVEVFDEDKESFGLKFNTITVNPKKKATLVVHNEKPSEEVTAELYYEQEKIKPKKKKLVTENEKQTKPISNLDIKVKPVKDFQKAAYRNTFSGPIHLNIVASIPEDIEELLYSIDGKVVGSITDKQVLDLASGTYEIQVFGKDVLERPIKSNLLKVNIDKEAPSTQLLLSVTPDGATASFNVLNNNSKVETFCKFDCSHIDGLTHDQDLNEWFIVPGNTKQFDIPEHIWRQLRIDRNAYVSINYYSENEFGLKEEIKSFDFAIRDLPVVMWSEGSTVATAKSIFKNVTGNTNEEYLEAFEVKQKIQNKVTDLDPQGKIGDNVKSVLFVSKAVIIEVFYAEKYALYFSGPPTELLEVGQRYTFSFELITERSKEKIVTTEPVAKLKPMKNNIKAKNISLTEDRGVFSGSFVVDELFKEYKHKLIITDIKNISPPLRESTLMLRGEES
ncbi:lipase/acyltransferase domain-containing protein [Priestia megaterium]|uniref:lipase/acyltransferase domain-containing protein n=1 Tax=Priestia megaterium TaxID=1404 RepID=UPI003CC5A93E